jgi:DNA-binding transcriptional ArsR family regulator
VTPSRARGLSRLAPHSLARAADIIKLLGHRERLMILEALDQGERTVSELCRACGLPQAICSQHLRRLRALDIVSCRKDGQNVHYRVIEPRVRGILACVGDDRQPRRRA